jgi:multiple sugar transport system substrate-binding protein
MDENVVFDKTQSTNQPNQADTPTSPESTPEETPIDTNQPDPQPTDQTEPQTPVDETGGEEGTGQTEEGSQEPPEEEGPPPPPPPFGLAILQTIGQNSLLKKVLIGIGILFIVLIIVLIALPKKQATKDVTLTWWGLWEDQNVVSAIISDFEKQNPHIKIKYAKQDPKNYREKLLDPTRVQNNTAPDVFRYHNSWYPMLSQVLAPLPQDVITPQEFEKNYYPVAQTDLIHNGGIYGIPLGIDTLALFVNTDILESAGVQVPANWDDFQKAALKLTVKDTSTGKIKTSGAALGTFSNITHAPDIIASIFVQQGVDMQKFPAEGKKQIDPLNYYTSFSLGDNATWDSTLDESILSFAKGNLAMYFGYSWDVFTIDQLNKQTNYKLNYKIYPLPSLYGVSKTIASYWVEGVSAKSPNQKEALLFMKYLSQKETAQKFYTEASKVRPFGEPYARKDLADQLKGNPLVYPFVQQANTATSTFFSSDTHDGDGGINFVSNNYLSNAVESIVFDNASADTAVETLDQGIAQVFEKYGILQQ